MPRLVAMAMALLLAGCITVVKDPMPSFRVSDGTGEGTLYYDGDTVETKKGRALEVRLVLPEAYSEDEIADITLEQTLEDQDTLGIVPHWDTGVFVVYGKKKGEVTLKAGSSHVTFVVQD